MNVKDAVAERIRQLCSRRNITYNALAVNSGVTPSTVYSLLDASRRHTDITTIKILCDGLDMSLPEFFDDPLFRDLEQEIC